MSASPNDADEAGGDRVNEVTKAEEELEAHADHPSDRPPSSDEEAAAERTKLDPSVAEHEREMDKIGAEFKGEGKVR